MDLPFYIGSICVTPQTLEREIQFSVTNNGAYLFRLVPTLDGFALSKTDFALNQQIDHRLVKLVSNAIESHYS